MPNSITLTVIIITWNRPEYVLQSLTHVLQQTSQPDQIIVVDASLDNKTKEICQSFSKVEYLPFPHGAKHMTKSRNFALQYTTSEVIAYIDDDSFPQENWSKSVKELFMNPEIMAATGRTTNPGTLDEIRRSDSWTIGQLLDNGTFVENFHLNPPFDVEIVHGIGANMAFRRQILFNIGGFRDDFWGTAFREDADIFIRIYLMGEKMHFSPRMHAVHVGAPHVIGSRFDFRYQFWARHNHLLLLTRNFGWSSPLVRRWILGEIKRTFSMKRNVNFLRHWWRIIWYLSGLLSGFITSLIKSRWKGLSPKLKQSNIGLY